MSSHSFSFIDISAPKSLKNGAGKEKPGKQLPVTVCRSQLISILSRAAEMSLNSHFEFISHHENYPPDYLGEGGLSVIQLVKYPCALTHA